MNLAKADGPRPVASWPTVSTLYNRAQAVMEANAAEYIPSDAQPASTSTLRPFAPPFFISSPEPLLALKPRVCEFFSTSKGCRHGQKCRFMHEREGDVSLSNAKPGEWDKRLERERAALLRRAGHVPAPRRDPDQLVTRIKAITMEARDLPLKPLEKQELQDVPCKFWKAGYCSRGRECYFAHAAPEVVQSSASDADDDTDPHRPSCGVCYEDNCETYGLLKNCSHPFCLKCIHEWRTRTGKSVETGMAVKTCPLCRQNSPFVIPSNLFYPAGPRKDQIISHYMKVMRDQPCRYLARSMKGTQDEKRAFCPFGDDCHYSHMRRGRTIKFGASAAENMPKFRLQRHGSNGPSRDFMLNMIDEFAAGGIGNPGRITEVLRGIAQSMSLGPLGLDDLDDGVAPQNDAEGDDDEDGNIADVVGPDGTSIMRRAPRQHVLPSGQLVADEAFVPSLSDGSSAVNGGWGPRPHSEAEGPLVGSVGLMPSLLNPNDEEDDISVPPRADDIPEADEDWLGASRGRVVMRGNVSHWLSSDDEGESGDEGEMPWDSDDNDGDVHPWF